MASKGSASRALCAVVALSALVSACSSAADEPAPSPAMAGAAAPQAHSTVPPPACGDGPALLANMSTRDKLAQLLMVGVNDAADARAVVDTYHVGGIMIGSWTDLSMLTDGSLPDIADAGPAAAGGQRRRGGRPGVAAVLADRRQPVGPGAGADQDPRARCTRSRWTAARQMRGLGITIDFAPVVDVTDAADDTVIGDRSFSNDPAVVTDLRRRLRPRPARRRSAAGAQALPRPRPRLGRLAHRGAVTTPPLAELQNSDLVPYRTLTDAGAGRASWSATCEVPGLTGSDTGQPQPGRGTICCAAAATAARRSTARCSPTTCPAWPPSPIALRRRRGGPARPAGRCRRRRCGSPPTRCPRCSTGWRRRSTAASCRMPRGRRVGAADGRRQRAQSALRRLSRSRCRR